jgi:hypothetical protein
LSQLCKKIIFGTHGTKARVWTLTRTAQTRERSALSIQAQRARLADNPNLCLQLNSNSVKKADRPEM